MGYYFILYIQCYLLEKYYAWANYFILYIQCYLLEEYYGQITLLYLIYLVLLAGGVLWSLDKLLYLVYLGFLLEEFNGPWTNYYFIWYTVFRASCWRSSMVPGLTNLFVIFSATCWRSSMVRGLTTLFGIFSATCWRSSMVPGLTTLLSFLTAIGKLTIFGEI